MLAKPIALRSYTADEAIESLCQEGCQAVRLYIEQLQNNSPIELLSGLSDQEKQTVLIELQSIMSVYNSCAS